MEPTSPLNQVETLLQQGLLCDKSRAFLLLNLVELLLVHDRTAEAVCYWQQFEPLRQHVEHPHANYIEALLHGRQGSATKDVDRPFVTEIASARPLIASDPPRARQMLEDIEARINKKSGLLRSLVGGVTYAPWVALVDAWAALDRVHAFTLAGHVPAFQKKHFHKHMALLGPLTTEEYDTLYKNDHAGLLTLLAEKPISARLSEALLKGVAATNRATWGEDTITPFVNLITSQFTHYPPTLLAELQEQKFQSINKRYIEAFRWPDLFNILRRLIELGVVTGALTDEALERWLKGTPKPLMRFLWAHYAAHTAPPDDAGSAYRSLMERTGKDIGAEWWFLATLVRNKRGAEGLALAEKSPRGTPMVCRVKRVWLGLDPNAAAMMHGVRELSGDMAAEFLAQGSPAARLAFIKRITRGGQSDLPSVLWEGDTREALRKRANFSKLGQANPLYHYADVQNEQSFIEALEMAAGGGFERHQLDPWLAEAFVTWCAEEGDSGQMARRTLRNMWVSFKLPIEASNETMIDFTSASWFREGTIERWCSVLAADPDLLMEDVLGWLKQRYVSGSVTWQSGNAMRTFSLKPAALVQYGVISAASVLPHAPDAAEHIITRVYAMYAPDRLLGADDNNAFAAVTRVAVDIYLKQRPLLHIAPPVDTLKPDALAVWQTAVIERALPTFSAALHIEAHGLPTP